MNSDLQSLRDRALNRTVNALHRESLCLDEDAAAQLEQLERALDAAKRKRQDELDKIADGGGDARMAVNPVTDANQLIADIESDLERQREAAADDTIVLIHGRLKPADYDALLKAHTADDKLDLDEFAADLAAKTFRRAESVSGEDLGLSWEELGESVLSHGDVERLHSAVIAHNRKAVVIPFSKKR